MKLAVYSVPGINKNSLAYPSKMRSRDLSPINDLYIDGYNDTVENSIPLRYRFSYDTFKTQWGGMFQ